MKTDKVKHEAVKIEDKCSVRQRTVTLCILFTAFIAAISCSSIDCPLNSLVYTQYGLLDPTGRTDTLRDTLTISTVRANGNDSVLINRDYNITQFSLPISYAGDYDMFYFEMRYAGEEIPTLDTVTVYKENTPHFESVDCSPTFFHTITDVTYTGNAIDSISINHTDVNYDTSKKHFNIYFKHRN
ncbi:MAG: DUF6452 family protein [Prevotella sp.]